MTNISTDQPITPADEQVLEALAAAYTAGATDVHEWWAAGNVEREADFGEAASDYARSIDLTALATRPSPVVDGLSAELAKDAHHHGGVVQISDGLYYRLLSAVRDWEQHFTALSLRPAPETTTSDDVVEARGKLTAEYLAMTPLQKWDALTLHGLLGTNEPWIADMRDTLSNLPKPTEQATNPAHDAVMQERVTRALLAEAPEQVRHAKHCAGWNRGDEECDCGAEDYLARIDAALASSSRKDATSKPTSEGEREAAGPWQRVGTFTPEPDATYIVQGTLRMSLKRGSEIDQDNLLAAKVRKGDSNGE